MTWIRMSSRSRSKPRPRQAAAARSSGRAQPSVAIVRPSAMVLLEGGNDSKASRYSACSHRDFSEIDGRLRPRRRAPQKHVQAVEQRAEGPHGDHEGVAPGETACPDADRHGVAAHPVRQDALQPVGVPLVAGTAPLRGEGLEKAQDVDADRPFDVAHGIGVPVDAPRPVVPHDAPRQDRVGLRYRPARPVERRSRSSGPCPTAGRRDELLQRFVDGAALARLPRRFHPGPGESTASSRASSVMRGPSGMRRERSRTRRMRLPSGAVRRTLRGRHHPAGIPRT